MADERNLRNRYWNRLKQLQNEHLQARKAGDFALAKKKKEDLRAAASDPFDSYISRLNNPNYESNKNDIEETGESDTIESQFGKEIRPEQQPTYETAGEIEARRLQEQALQEKPQFPPDKEEVPGGPAREASPKAQTQVSAPTEGAQKGAVGGTVERGKQATKEAASQAIDAVKKAAAQVAKKAVVTFFSSPWGWAVTAAIIGLIILILIAILFFSIIQGSHSVVSETGRTFSQPTDPLKDKEWIRKLLWLNKSESVTKALTTEALAGLEDDLNELKEDPTYNAHANVIQQVLDAITAYKTSPTTENGDTIISKLGDLGVAIFSIPVMPTTITTTKPAGQPFSELPRRLSQAIHIGTPLNPCSGACGKVAGMPARTFEQFKGNTCDAVDLYASNGSSIKALFSGKVTRDNDQGNSGVSEFRIESLPEGTGYEAVYAHMSSNKFNVGDTVQAGTEIGIIGEGHLHFELMHKTQGKTQCVIVTQKEYDEGKKNDLFEQEILWSKMKAVMRL